MNGAEDRRRAEMRRLHGLADGTRADPFPELSAPPPEPAAKKRKRNGNGAAHHIHTSDDPALPAGFKITEHGLYWLDPDPERAELRIADPLRIEAMTTDGRGRAWGRLLTWNDPAGREHRWAMPMSLLAGDQIELRQRLMDSGLTVAAGRKARERFAEYLMLAKPERRVLVTESLGWHGGSFVLADETIEPGGARPILFQTDRFAALPALNVSGTLEDWRREVAALAAGNSRLAFAIAAAFAAPLLGPLDVEGGGFHLRGASSVGKTSAQHAAGSVWGGGGKLGYLRSWRATDNGLEAAAAAHCDLLLVLDEINEASPETVSACAYALANGAGKGRAARDGGARRIVEWRVLFLSSGEHGLASRLADARGGPRRPMAGQEVRVLDLPADAGRGLGLFEDTRGEPPARFAERVEVSARAIYGTAGRAWLRWLVDNRDEATREARAHIEAFRSRFLPAGASGQVERALRRFAVVAAAGELAAAVGILPWPEGEAIRAARTCFEAWLGARDGRAGSAEDAAAIAAVRRFIEAHGEARFAPLLRAADGGDVEPERPTINRAGWRRRAADGTWTYWLPPETWRVEVCAGFDPQHVARVLALAGHLEREGPHFTMKKRVPGVGMVRVYAVLPSILEG